MNSQKEKRLSFRRQKEAHKITKKGRKERVLVLRIRNEVYKGLKKYKSDSKPSPRSQTHHLNLNLNLTPLSYLQG